MGRDKKMDNTEALEHLEYELKMFVTTYRILAQKLFKENAIHNALMESFAIHARNLIAFLYYENKNDYVVANDFVADIAMWKKERCEQSSCIKNATERANNLVAHLTYERLEILTKQSKWEIEVLYKEIIKVFKLFLKHKRTNSEPKVQGTEIVNEYSILLAGMESERTSNWISVVGTTSNFPCLSACLIDSEEYEIN